MVRLIKPLTVNNRLHLFDLLKVRKGFAAVAWTWKDDSGCVPVFCFLSLAARVPIEETVETKEVELRAEIPTKGTSDLNAFLLQLSALSGKTKLICPSSAPKIFDFFSFCTLSFLFFYSIALLRHLLFMLQIDLSHYLLWLLSVFSIFCCASLLHL